MQEEFLILSRNTKEVFKKIIDDAVSAITNTIDSANAFSGINPYALRSIISKKEILPACGVGWRSVMEDINHDVLPHMLRSWDPSYMPHLHSPALIESIASELIIASFNNSMDSWDQSPVQTEIEEKVIKTLTSLFGYDDNGDGTFTSGGSQSNLAAITAHRDSFLMKGGWDVKKNGLPPYFDKLRIYTSEISHFSMEKSAHLLGLGYKSVVKLPVDGKCSIDIVKAEEIIKSDVDKGLIPFLFVATIGTTDFGSIDDIEKIRKICNRYKMFLHSDAAYGSGAIMSSRYSDRLGPLYLSDSITIDFHKMFLLPISCSAVIFKDKKELECFALHADYLNREEDEEDGYINLVSKSIQTTRRSDAFKVYLSFMMRGKNGFASIIDHDIEIASYFYNKISSDPLFLAPVSPRLSSVVFKVNKSDNVNKRIRRALLEKGIIIGQTVYNGSVMLKFTLLNPEINEEKIDFLIEEIKKLSEKF